MFSPRHIFKRVQTGDQQALELRFQNISRPTFEFFVLLGSSTVIATLGLFQNSAAVIIGAMIIAPLMRPLMGLTLGSITADARLVKRALMTLAAGSAFGICISYTGAQLLQSIQLTPEILGRTHPTLLDLGVALAAGAVGAYCQSKEDIRDSLAGVAIAVALVPPLSVVGIGLARGSMSVACGAAVLYATNLIGITVAAATILLLMGYSPVNKAKKAIFASLSFLAFLMVPLGFSMRELILENRLSMEINNLLKEKTFTFKNARLQSVEAKRFQTPMVVIATVYGAENDFQPWQVRAVQNFLIKNTGIDLQFRLRVIPVKEIPGVELTTDGVDRTSPVSPEQVSTPEQDQQKKDTTEPIPPHEQPTSEKSPPQIEPPALEPKTN